MDIPGHNSGSSVLKRESGVKAGGISRLLLSRAKEIGSCVALGGAGALVFAFVFPAAAISTLMHAVLHLPGPGAGIALIMGPLVVLAVMGASLMSRTRGGALAAALGFAVFSLAIVRLSAISTNPKGAIGTPLFIGAVALSGLAVEAVLRPGKSKPGVARCLLTGAAANLVLLLFYWLAIFPRTAGWVSLRNVPLLTTLCLSAGLLAGYVAGLLFKPLPGAFSAKYKE